MVVAPAHRETVSNLLAKGAGYALKEEKNRLQYFCASRRASYTLSTLAPTHLSVGASAVASVPISKGTGLTNAVKATTVEADIYYVWDEYVNGAGLDL